MVSDALGDVAWECTACAPGTFAHPHALSETDQRWLPATVPGTAAAALLAAGEWSLNDRDGNRFDDEDWWYRTSFALPGAPTSGKERWWLELGGLATIASVWVDGELVAETDNMFLPSWRALSLAGGDHTLVIRFAALTPLMAAKHPRPRWKSQLVHSQNMRWYRTSYLGRMPATPAQPAPVGPWRPVRLLPGHRPAILARGVRATIVGNDGMVDFSARMVGIAPSQTASLIVVPGGATVSLDIEVQSDGSVNLSGQVRVTDVERWWPHTHGDPARYHLEVKVGGDSLDAGHVGFRSVTVDRSDGGFALSINGLPIFCRGACWMPVDPVGFTSDPAATGAELRRARDTGLNMVRVMGISVHEDEAWWDHCDELGLLVWQDLMWAALDPPEDPEWSAGYEAEVRSVVGRSAGHPALAVVSGGSEVEQQAAMLGLSPDRWVPRLLTGAIASAVAEVAPDIPYVTSTPTGGTPPFTPGEGVAHYFGVGAYLRPLEDARRSRVRFAAECLAMSIPPDDEMVDKIGGSSLVGHDPGWKAGVPRDPGAAWDFEDVRNHYVRLLHGVDPATARSADPTWALDLGRATVAEVMVAVFAEWRRSASGCAGGIIQAWRDQIPGAGWGLMDVTGRPKAPWYALRRLLAPRAAWFMDEGLGGLRLHIANDRSVTFSGTIRIERYAPDGLRLDTLDVGVDVAPASVTEMSVDGLLEGWRDLTYAYRFGPPAHDLVVATLVDADGALLSVDHFLPLGADRPRLADLRLRASLSAGCDSQGGWGLEITTGLFAQWVNVVASGFEPSESWFHLAPGATTTIALQPSATDRSRPRGEVRALNCLTSTRITSD